MGVVTYIFKKILYTFLKNYTYLKEYCPALPLHFLEVFNSVIAISVLLYTIVLLMQKMHWVTVYLPPNLYDKIHSCEINHAS